MKEKCFFILAACAMILSVFAGCSASSGGGDDSGQNQEYPYYPPYDKYYQILLKETELTLNVGETYQLAVEIRPERDDDIFVYYNSDDDRIASVSESGLVSAKSFGSTRICVGSEKNKDTSCCYITVNDPNMLTRENAAEILGKDYRYKTTIVIPEGITGIGSDAFDASSLGWFFAENIVIPNTVTYIADNAFAGCYSIKNIVIPSSVTSIGYNAFGGCENLQDVYIENIESYEQIEFGNEWSDEYSRPDCYGAKFHIGEAFDIPSEEITILTRYNVGKIIPDDYYSRGHIDIPNGVILIENYAFEDYGQNLKSITIPSSITFIESDAFNNCSNLQSVVFSDGIISIGDCVFEYCNSLQSVTIPSSVTSIGRNAFYYCVNLKEVNIESLESWFGINFANTEANPLRYAKRLCVNGEELTNLVIPDGTTKINKYAFYNYESLQSVTIPSGRMSIGDNAFYNCTNLQNITILDGLTSISIAYSAFTACDNLNAVNIESVEGWLGINFGDYNDNPLTYAHHLYVDGEELTNLVIPDGTTKINKYAFYNYESLQSVTIPSSLTSIEESAFYECNNIKTVYVENHETWRNLNIGYTNKLRSAKIIFGDDGEVGITVKFPKEEKEDVPNLEWTKNGNAVTISAESGHSSYAWFLDMQKQSTVESALEFDTTNKKAGLYSVMVVIDGKYSATATIEVLK